MENWNWLEQKRKYPRDCLVLESTIVVLPMLIWLTCLGLIPLLWWLSRLPIASSIDQHPVVYGPNAACNRLPSFHICWFTPCSVIAIMFPPTGQSVWQGLMGIITMGGKWMWMTLWVYLPHLLHALLIHLKAICLAEGAPLPVPIIGSTC